MMSRLACGEVFSVGVRAMARRGSNLFNRNDLRRAIRSAQEMGLSVDSVEVGRDGKIIVRTSRGRVAEPDGGAQARDLDDWMEQKKEKHARHQLGHQAARRRHAANLLLRREGRTALAWQAWYAGVPR
jgi:hypothetical protein